MKIKDVQAFAIRMAPVERGGQMSQGGLESHLGFRGRKASPEGETPRPDSEEYGDYFIARDSWTSIYSRRHETSLVRIESDEGVVGWGEGQAPVSPRAVKAIVEDLCRPVLLGRDPFDVEFLWYRLYSAMRERGHVTGLYIDALAGVDLALYDLLGKALGKPVHRMIGGRFRDTVPVYAGIGGTDSKAIAQAAKEHVDLGYQALKLHLRVPNRQLLGIVESVRAAVGDDVILMVDVHTTRDVSSAIELGRGLEALGVRWLESPTGPEDVRGHAEIASALDVQIASGEWLRTVWEWRWFIERRAVDVAMPDIGRTGLSEGKRIAALCDTYNIPIAPHVGGGGILSVAASVQFSAAIPSLQILEHSHHAHARKAAVASEFPAPVRGRFELNDEPGLGVTINEDAVRRYAG